VTIRENGTRLLYLITIVILFPIALSIPSISKTAHATPAIVEHPALFPVYFQTNTDAIVGLHNSLHFPDEFRTSSYRVNRPLLIGLSALIRHAVSPLQRMLPTRLSSMNWGDSRMVDVLVTYAAWLFLNLLLALLTIKMTMTLLTRLIGSTEAFLSTLLFISTPIFLLSMREITEGMVQLTMVSATALLFHSAYTDSLTKHRLGLASIALGMLLLGKLAITTLVTASFLLLLSRKRARLLILLPCCFAPYLGWVAWLHLAHIPFTLNEVHAYSPALTEFATVTLFHRLTSFIPTWWATLAEDGLWLLLPFAIVGTVTAIRNRTPLLFTLPLFGLTQFIFYAALNRSHAVYGMETLFFINPLAATGMQIAARRIAKTLIKTGTPTHHTIISMIFLLLIQTIILFQVLPRYAG